MDTRSEISAITFVGVGGVVRLEAPAAWKDTRSSVKVAGVTTGVLARA